MNNIKTDPAGPLDRSSFTDGTQSTARARGTGRRTSLCLLTILLTGTLAGAVGCATKPGYSRAEGSNLYYGSRPVVPAEHQLSSTLRWTMPDGKVIVLLAGRYEAASSNGDGLFWHLRDGPSASGVGNRVVASGVYIPFDPDKNVLAWQGSGFTPVLENRGLISNSGSSGLGMTSTYHRYVADVPPELALRLRAVLIEPET